MISPQQAQKTITVTMQLGVRTCLNPTMARRYPTNDRMLHYKRLPHPIFTDTMFAGPDSVGGNKCAQVYTTSFGWCRAHPMKRKGEAHETLSLLFHHDGMPPSMIADNSKEQILGEFKRKLNDANCHLKQMEPYSPWMQTVVLAKGCTRDQRCVLEDDQIGFSQKTLGSLYYIAGNDPLLHDKQYLHDRRASP